MKRLICIVLGWLLIQATLSAAPSHDKNKDKRGGPKHSARTDDRTDTRVGVHIAFGRADVTIIREHYAARYRNLPPGLRKKVARGGQLPPGWQKKYEPFPVAVERRLTPLSPEYRRGVIDGHAVIYNTRTNVIIDVAVLF
jgi:hypothetical protein